MPLKIVDEHSYAYEFVQTPDLQRLCPSSLPEFFPLNTPLGQVWALGLLLMWKACCPLTAIEKLHPSWWCAAPFM